MWDSSFAIIGDMTAVMCFLRCEYQDIKTKTNWSSTLMQALGDQMLPRDKTKRMYVQQR